MPDKLPKQQLPFSAIFPESHIFLPSWPAEPPGLADRLSSAGIVNIPVYLLESVELELEAHRVREARGAIDKLKGQRNKLPGPLAEAYKIEIPTWTHVTELIQKAWAKK